MEPLLSKGSATQMRALTALRDELQSAGFYVERPRANEETLRVYPVRRHELPLLNPRFVTVEDDTTRSRRAVALEIAVLSRGISGLATRLLSFAPSAACRFEHRAAMAGSYRQHGIFSLPLVMRGDLPVIATEELKRIHHCLTAPAGRDRGKAKH